MQKGSGADRSCLRQNAAAIEQAGAGSKIFNFDVRSSGHRKTQSDNFAINMIVRSSVRVVQSIGSTNKTL